MIMKKEVLRMTLGDNLQYLRKVNDITQEIVPIWRYVFILILLDMRIYLLH